MHTGVIIALIPRDQRGDEHMTLLYAGDLEEGLVSAPEPVIRETCNRLSNLFAPFPAYVTGHDTFGDDEPVQVATIDAPQIWQLRACVEPFQNSQFGLRPHITAVNGQLRQVGEPVWIDRIASWYGDERTVFRLGVNTPLYAV